MRRLERFPVRVHNSMSYWPRLVPVWRVCWNFALLETSRFLPFLGLKSALLRLLGMRVGRNVSVGLMAMFDIFHPELVSIGDEAILGYNCTVLCHEFLPREYRLGRVEIGAGVLLGANVTVLPGVRIGEGAIVAAGAVVATDIPPRVLAAGVPARVVRPLEEEEILAPGS